MTTENEAVVEQEVEQSTDNSTEVESEVGSEVETKEEDYSWVPKKFLKNGEPDLQGMAKSYQALEKRLGSKSLASEAIEDYQFDSKFAEHYSEEASNAFKAEAQKAGLSPEQYAWIMEKYEQNLDSAIQSNTPEAAEGVLRQAWGKSFDAQLNNARAAWDAFAPSDMDINSVGNNPAVLKILARVGAELGEDKPTARNSSRPSVMNEEQINEIIRSKDYSTDLKKQETVRAWYEKNYRD